MTKITPIMRKGAVSSFEFSIIETKLPLLEDLFEDMLSEMFFAIILYIGTILLTSGMKRPTNRA